MGESHPALYKRPFCKIKWNSLIREDLKINENETMKLNLESDIDNHYNLELFIDSKRVYISFWQTNLSVTSGQFVSWYIDDELIGSGTIN